MQETRIRSLDGEDPLEKEMANYSSILAGKNPWMEEPDGLRTWGHKQLGKTEWLSMHTPLLSRIPVTLDLGLPYSSVTPS